MCSQDWLVLAAQDWSAFVSEQLVLAGREQEARLRPEQTPALELLAQAERQAVVESAKLALAIRADCNQCAAQYN
jgi:hypothetical protein